MMKPVQALLFLLKNKIYVNDNVIPIIKRNYPLDKTPCLTIEDTTGGYTLQKDFLQLSLPYPEGHPQYDNGKHWQQVLRKKRSVTLNLNLYCNNEFERDVILAQVENIFDEVFSNHYKHCCNFKDGDCSTLNRECEAIASVTGRALKNQCPYPEKNEYCNVFSKYDLIPKSFNVEPPFSLDDLDVDPPLLRSIMKINIVYYDYHVIGGGELDSVNIEGLYNDY